MSNSKGSILISNANAVGTALVNKLGGTGYTPNEWPDKINLLGIADADIPTALAGITEGSYTGEDRGAIKICNANNVGTMLNKKFNTNRGFKPSEWESAISKLIALTTGTASGSVVSIADGADDVPVVNCIASVDPVQDLHGYSKPWPAGGGKNLLENTGVTTTDANVTFTVNNDGSVTLNGTATSEVNFTVYSNFEFPSTGNYVISGCPSGGSTSTYRIFATNYGSDTGSGLSVNVIDTTVKTTIRINIKSGVNTNGLVFKPMIEAGSTATTYEPYSNICPISGNTETTVYQFGKNLVDGTNFTRGLPSTSIGSSIDTISASTRYAYFGTPIKGGNYTVSSVSNDTDYFNSILIFGYSKGFLSIYTNASVNVSKTVNLSSCDYVRIAIGSRTVQITVPTDFTDYGTIQLENGSSATTYEPYKAKTPINIQFNQTVYGADVDAKSGNNYNTARKFVVTNTQEWIDYIRYIGSGDTAYIQINSSPASNNRWQDLKCSHFEPANIYAGGTQQGIGCYQSQFYIRDSRFTSKQDFVDFIIEQQSLGKPLEVCYKLNSPQPFTTDPNDISTYKNNNVFYNTTGDTSVTYYKGV